MCPVANRGDFADWKALVELKRQPAAIQRAKKSLPPKGLDPNRVKPEQFPGERADTGNQPIHGCCHVRLRINQQLATGGPLIRRQTTRFHQTADPVADQR